MRVFTYSEARQQFADVLNYAQNEGEVCIRRKDGSAFRLLPTKHQKKSSPLDIKGVALKLSAADIVNAIHDSRGGRDYGISLK